MTLLPPRDSIFKYHGIGSREFEGLTELQAIVRMPQKAFPAPPPSKLSSVYSVL